LPALVTSLDCFPRGLVLKLSSTSHVKFLWSIISEVAAIQSDQSQQEGIQVHPCRYLLPLFLILH
jgi:hypothetical protein